MNFKADEYIGGIKLDGKVICNVCGKELKIENGILKEDAFEVYKEWGYFSEKDLEVHKFVICEKCYDEWIKTFALPIDITKKQEVL